MSMGWPPAETDGRMLPGPLMIAGWIVDAYAEGAKVFWSFWGPLGEPVINAVEMVAGMQRRYLALLAEAFEEAAGASRR